MSNGGREGGRRREREKKEGDGEERKGVKMAWKDGWMDGKRKKTEREKRQKLDRQMTGKEQQERGNTGWRESED